MPKKPTTRRGRYLYFQRKYKGRYRKLMARKRYPGGKERRRYGRERVTGDLVKQSDAGRPKVVRWVAAPNTTHLFEYLPPTYEPRRFPLWRITDPDAKASAERLHLPVIGAQRRRTQRVGKLKSYPVKPYETPPRDPPWYVPEF